MNNTSKSYQVFNDIYFPVFEKLNNSKDTIFENMDYRPNVDALYKDFVKSDEYQLFLEAESIIDKRGIVTNWILENVFLESYFLVKNKLILENEELPYNIEYKLNNSYNVIMESASTATFSTLGAITGLGIATFGSGLLTPLFGIALTALSISLGFSDSDRKAIEKSFKTAGKVIGKILTLDSTMLDMGTKKEIVAIIKSLELTDSAKECIEIVGWNPAESNKITRFIEKLKNSHKEYDYAQCIGIKIVRFYVSSLEVLYKILRSSSVDDKIFDIMENSFKRGVLNEMVFRNMARLSKDKHVYKLIEVINKTTEKLNGIIDAFVNSDDHEYARIGHNISKTLDSDLRELAYKIHKERAKRDMRPALNRRPGGVEIMKERRDDRNRYDNRDNRRDHGSRDRSRNPF